MQINTPEEAWKVLAEGKEIVSLYKVRFKLQGNAIFKMDMLDTDWVQATYPTIGTAPWTIYKEPEKKPEKLELFTREEWIHKPIDSLVARLNEIVVGHNWLLENTPEKN